MTRLHEAVKADCGSSNMKMGRIYRDIEKHPGPQTQTRAEWWAEYSALAASTNTLYGVGVKAKSRKEINI